MLRTMALGAAAMVAFAANSLLCRLALGEQLIDPGSFAALRVASGALLLAVLAGRARLRRSRRDLVATVSLAVYLWLFTYAYVELQAGIGALLLFGAVQLTMLTAGLAGGERFAPVSWTGFAVAAAGLIYLLAPSADAPAPHASAAMVVAGAAWGVYSLRGRAVGDALAATASNFVLAAPLVVAVAALSGGTSDMSPRGAGLAVASGTIASALGYVIWYAAVARLRALSAATMQLSVPVITAVGAVLLLGEPLTARLILAAAAVLGGIALAVVARGRAAATRQIT